MFLLSLFKFGTIVRDLTGDHSARILLAVSRQRVFPFDVSCPSSQFESLIVSQLHFTTTLITYDLLSMGQPRTRLFLLFYSTTV